MPNSNEMFVGGWVSEDELLSKMTAVAHKDKPDGSSEKRMVMEIVGEGDFPDLEE